MLALPGFTWYTSTANDLHRFVHYNSVDLDIRAQDRLMRRTLALLCMPFAIGGFVFLDRQRMLFVLIDSEPVDGEQ